MGVIDIAPRRVSLGNLPGVRQVNTDTGAGLRGAAGAQLGRAVAGFGMELNRTANALEERRQRNAAWDYINKFQAAMRADDEAAAKKGIADGEDPEKWVEGRIKRRGEIESRVAQETGIDKKSLALAEKHLAGFNLSTQSKWAARALSVTKGRELNAAKTAVDNAGTVLLDAMDSEDETERIAALASWNEALANLAGQDETLGEEGINALRRTKSEELLRASLARKLETLTAISETQGPKEVEQSFHDFLQKFADDGTKALVNGTYKGADGFENDLMERDLRGMDEKAFDLAARRDIETARQKAVARAERRDIEEVEAVLNEGVVAASTVKLTDSSGKPVDRVQAIESVITRAETLARTKPRGSQAAAKAAAGVDHLDALADQVASEEMIAENFDKLMSDPGFRMEYPKGTRKGKLCERVQAQIDKERAKRTDSERKSNAEGLSRSLNRLNALKLEGSVSQEEAALAQGAIWAKYRTCLIAGSLPDGFEKTFLSSIKTELSDQEANAMRKFYKAFGYSPDMKGDGDVGVSERNAAKNDFTNYYAPMEKDGQRVENISTRVRARELLEYGDALLKTLRTLGPDVNREGVVEKEISRLKSQWIAGNVKKNIQATVDAARKSAIIFRGRMRVAPEGKQTQEQEQ